MALNVLTACRALRLHAAGARVAPRVAAACAPASPARASLATRGAACFAPRRAALVAPRARSGAMRRCVATRAAAVVGKGDAVGVRFTARTADGREVDSSSSAQGDAFFIVGEEPPRVPGLDAAVTGLALGGKTTKTVPAAFGPRSDADIIRVPGAMAPPGLEVGDTVRMGDGRPGLITAVSSSEIVVDVNHPMAGQDVVLDVEVVAHTPAEKLQFFVGGLGCFWGPELAFARVPGVMSTAVGYANGTTKEPSYESVCSGATGHAEVVRIAFDPAVVTFDDLLAVFWKKHDPTQLNRQGGDVGTQYRSCVLAADDAQLAAARASAEKEAARRGVKALATEIAPLTCYYRAEEYHQQYLAKGGRNGNAQSPAKMCNDPIRCYG